jgi:hypothetical protein
MKNIYKEAKKRNITIYPYQKDRLDNTKDYLIIPKDFLSKLSDEEFKDYIDALYCVKNENAGGYDGWDNAHKKFKKLGFVKKEKKLNSFRTAIHYEFEVK